MEMNENNSIEKDMTSMERSQAEDSQQDTAEPTGISNTETEAEQTVTNTASLQVQWEQQWERQSKQQDWSQSDTRSSNEPSYDKRHKGFDPGCLSICIFGVLVLVFVAMLIALQFIQPPEDADNSTSSGDTAAASTSEPTDVIEALDPTDIVTETPYPTNRPLPEYDGKQPTIVDTANPFPEIIGNVQQGVVSICNYANTVDAFGRNSLQVIGTGSGFLISSEGYLITNAHVISGAAKITAILPDETELQCKLIGSDVSTDIAVLQIDANGHNITPLYLGDSDKVRVGEFVITVGDPSGRELAGTITFGIVSAVNRSVNIDGRVNQYIQTDAAMNPGNSGGPLINSNGEVIGVNSAKTVTASYDESGNAISAEGLGFAIPINNAMNIVEQLISNGRIERPGLGITISPAPEELLYSEELSFGLYVSEVIENGPAYKGGIKAGDILLTCNGIELHENNDLTVVIQNGKVGDTYKFTLYRDGAEIEVSVTLGDLNNIG